MGARLSNEGFEGLYLSENGRALWLIQFETTPEWAPKRVSSYRMSGEPWDSGRDSFAQLAEWQMTNATASTWVKREDIGYVPATVSLYQQPRAETDEMAEAEVVLVDWQFDQEIDEKKLDDDQFSRKKLEEFSFEEIKSAILDSRKRAAERKIRN